MKKSIIFLLTALIVSAAAWAGMEMTSARIYKKQGDLARAVDFYNQEITKNPSNIEAVFERGELLGQIAMSDEHVGVRKQVAGESENPKLALLEKMIADFATVRSSADAKMLKKLDKKMKAQVEEYWWEFYKKAVAADSVCRVAKTEGRLLDLRSQLEEGLSAAETAIKIDPPNWSSKFVYAQLIGYMQDDDFRVTDIDDSAGVILNMDDYVEAWYQAIEALESSSLKLDNPEGFANNRRYARLQLAQHFFALEQYLKTLQMADQLLADEPGLVEAIQYQAFSLATLAGDESRSTVERDSLKHVAITALTTAREANKDDEIIVYYIGQFNLQLGDTASAMTAFNDYLTIVPDDKDVLFLQGLVYLEGEKFGDLPKAADTFRKITEIKPDNGAAWTNYGIALIRQGKTVEGGEAMKKGKELGN
ncbi:tetratricopeptide repeat protein [bacterium]|nr:tetratricopeptide repeat protein [bacterium]